MILSVRALAFCTDDLSNDPKVLEYWKFDSTVQTVTAECRGGAAGVLTVHPDGSFTYAKTNDLGEVLFRATGGAALPVKTDFRFSAVCTSTNALPLESQLELMGEANGKLIRTDPYLVLRGAGTAIAKQNLLVNKTLTKIAYLRGTKKPMTPVIRLSGAAATVTIRNWKARDLKAAKKRFAETRRKMKFPPPAQMSEADFAALLAADTDHTACLKVRDGRTVLLVDGQPSAPILSLLKGSRTNFFGADLQAAGVPIIGIPVRFAAEGYWTTNGFDAVRTVDSVLARMRLAPKALYLISFNLTAYDAMAREYPNEVWVDEKGLKVGKNPEHGGYAASLKPEVAANPKTVLWMSNLSPVWRQKVKDVLSATLAELKRRGAMKRVVAFHLSGYHDGQFATARPDYSPCAKAGYPKWLAAEKGNPGPKTYLAYLKRAPFAMQEDVMRHLKGLAGKDVLGVKWCMSAFGEGLASTYDITPLTRSDAIDIEIPQPSYAMREGGYPLGVRLPTNSLGRHGKMLMYEFDLRTPFETFGPTEFREFGLSRAETFPDFVDQNRKLAGIEFAHDSGFWYYDMKCGWFEPPEVRADIREVAATGRRLAARKPSAWHPSVAFVIDEDGLLARGGWLDGSTDPFRYGDISQTALDVLAASGVPFDSYLANDLADDAKLATSYRVLYTYGVDWTASDRRSLKAALDAAGVTVCEAKSLTPRSIRTTVAQAGGYIPARHGLQVDMNGDFASVHCLVPGHYDFTLPNGKVVPLDLRTGETRWLDSSRRNLDIDLRTARIVCANTNAPMCRLAASELESHLTLAAGARSPSSDGCAFVLGARPPGSTAPQPFESVATYVGGRLWLYGDDGENRPGTLFAVYEFLDRSLGVTWPFPGDGEAFVRPHAPFAPTEGWTIRFAPPLQMTEVRHADFWKKFKGKYRYAWLRTPEPLRSTEGETRRFTDEFARWLLRQRVFSRMTISYGHAFADWQGRYLKQHPDWFGLTDNSLLFRADTRNRGLPDRFAKRAKFCVSNPAVADAIVSDWVKRGTSKYFNICPNDGTPGFCRCENCLKLDARRPNEDFLATLTDRYVWFWNRIADRAVKIRPDVQIVTYIYSYYRLPPRRERIKHPDNMLFGVVPSLQDDIDAFFGGWRERGLRRFFLRPNYLGYSAAFHRGYERVIYEVFQKARSFGLMGVDFDGGCAERRQRDLEEYVVARMITHPDLPFETICASFYVQFGVAADDVRRVRERIRARGERSLARDIRGDRKRRILDDSLLGRFAVLAHDETSLAEDLRILRAAREAKKGELTADQLRRLDGEIVRAEHSLVTYRFMAAGEGDHPDLEKLKAAESELLAFRLEHKAEIGHAFEGFYDRTAGEDRVREKLTIRPLKKERK